MNMKIFALQSPARWHYYQWGAYFTPTCRYIHQASNLGIRVGINSRKWRKKTVHTSKKRIPDVPPLKHVKCNDSSPQGTLLPRLQIPLKNQEFAPTGMLPKFFCAFYARRFRR